MPGRAVQHTNGASRMPSVQRGCHRMRGPDGRRARRTAHASGCAKHCVRLWGIRRRHFGLRKLPRRPVLVVRTWTLRPNHLLKLRCGPIHTCSQERTLPRVPTRQIPTTNRLIVMPVLRGRVVPNGGSSEFLSAVQRRSRAVPGGWWWCSARAATNDTADLRFR